MRRKEREERRRALLDDLVGRAENEPFLHRLFACGLSEWTPVRELCEGLPREVADEVEALARDMDSGEPLAAWLLPPVLNGPREDWCTVMLYWHDTITCDFVLFNREVFRSRDGPPVLVARVSRGR